MRYVYCAKSLEKICIASLVQKLEKQGCLESIKQAVVESEYDVGTYVHGIILLPRTHAQGVKQSVCMSVSLSSSSSSLSA